MPYPIMLQAFVDDIPNVMISIAGQGGHSGPD